ncbi:MAG: GIY-YIG nuclease family protein [Nitrospirae bacterium]|nr:GIY-YIG nuclease family protein [Nitrospirota bacterium]
MTKPWHVYIALLADGRYYVGMTRLLPDVRAVRHRNGLGGQFTKRINVVRLLWFETHPTSESARRREQQLKKWSHAKKQALIEGDVERLKQLTKRRS